MSYYMVVPVIEPEVTAGFFEGLKIPHEHVIVIDNGCPAVLPDWDGPYLGGGCSNLGVAASWNLGAKAVMAQDRDWLVIASSALRWGPEGGLDFIAGMEACGDDPAVTSTLGWHLVAIHRSTLELVGLFDENFYPGYYEETDYLYRMAMAGLASPRENNQPWGFAHCDAEYGEESHALKIPAVAEEVQMNFLSYLYQRKWGGKPGNEQYTTPWGLPDYPIWKWPAR